MNRLLSIFILSIFVLSLLPPISLATPITMMGSHRKLFSGDHVDFYHVKEANGYIGFIATLNKGNHRGDIYFLTIKKDTGEIEFNSTIITDNGKAPYLASNGTHFLIAYAEYDGSNYHLVLVVHNGTDVLASKDISSEISSLPDSAGLYPVVAWMSNANAWVIGWFDNSHGDTLHVAIYDKYLNKVKTWDSSHTGSKNNRKYFVNALYDSVSGKAVLVGLAQGDSGSSYGIYIVMVSWEGASFTVSDRFLTSTSASEGSYYVFYYNARGPVAALTNGRLIVVYEASYKDPQPLKYTVYDMTSDSIIASGEIESSSNIAGGTYDEGAQPRVSAGNGYFVVTYTSKNDEVYAASIDINGNLLGKVKICDNGDHKRSWAEPIYNGTKYAFIILYPNATGSQIDLYAVRLNASTLQISDSVSVLTEAYNETNPVAYYSDAKVWFAYVGHSIDIYDLEDSVVPELPSAPAGPMLLPGQLNDLSTPSLAGRIVWVGGKWIAVWVEETDSQYHSGDLHYAIIDPLTGSVENSGIIVANAKDSRSAGGSPAVVVAGGKVVVAYVYYGGSTTKLDIGLAEIYPGGTINKPYNITDSGFQEYPTLAYDPSTGKLALMYYDSGMKLAVFDANDLAAGPVTVGLRDSSYYAFFSGDILPYNGYFVGIYINGTDYYGNITVFLFDESSNTIVYKKVIASGYVRKSASGPYLAYAPDADKFMAVWAMGEDANVYGSIFSVSGGTISFQNETMNLDIRPGTTLYPYVVNGTDYWLAVWNPVSGQDDIIGRIVYADGTTTNLIGIATLQNNENFARELYIGSLGTGEFVVLYRTWSLDGTDANITAVRINRTGGISSTPLQVTNYTEATVGYANETPSYVAFNGTKIGLFYTAESPTTSLDPFVGFIDPTTIPAPDTKRFLKPTAVFITYWGDEDGDHYIIRGSGERFHIQAKLYYYDEATETYYPLIQPNQNISITVKRYIEWDNTIHDDIYEPAAQTYALTDTNGEIDVYIDVPSDALSGLYVVELTYPGNSTIGYDSAPPNRTYPYDGTGVMVLPGAPTKTLDGNLDDWQSPTYTEAPTLEYKNGELILTDPQGDYRNDTTTNFGTEAQDLDILELHMAMDNNYLYIAYKVAGTAELDGDVVPALAIAFDLTPDNTSDGAYYGKKYNFKLFFNVYSTTTIMRKEQKAGWDFIVFITPTIWKSDQPGHELIPATPVLHIWKAYVGGRYDYVSYLAGKVVYNGGVVEAAIPLEALGWAHDNDPTVNILLDKNITIYQAIFPMSVTTGKTAEIDHARFVDFAGGVFDEAEGIIPATALKQGFTGEKWTDENIERYLLVAVDNTGKFYGYTKIYSENTTVYPDKKAYTGKWSYVFHVVDRFNPMFGVPSITVEALFNGTSVTGITNATGYVVLDYTIDLADNGKKLNLTVHTTGTSDYVALPRTFNLTIYVPVKVIDSNVTWIDNDGDGFVTKGDVLHLTAKVYTRLSDGTWGPVAGIEVAFVIHSTPYVLGTNTTDNNGVAVLTYTVTGDENVIGIHDITLDDTGTTDVLGGPVTLNGGARLYMALSPVPETPILPILLLAALLLFIIIKKRK